jgi:uncharacterized membrane protein
MVVAALLVTVVVAVSSVYLQRRALGAAADAAALTAANQPDLSALYQGTSGDRLPLREATARRAVEQYVVDAGLGRRFHDLEVVDVAVDGATVTVTVRAVAPLPLVGWLTGPVSGYPVAATASARSPLSS